MIKQIQLRGISRTPSDRMTSDGGCAESLNVYLDGGELAPTRRMEDATSDVLGHNPNSHEPVFIHKTPSYINYIYLGKNDDDNYVIMKKYGSVFRDVFTMSSGETLKQIKSIGNTLLILTSTRLEYVLYKDGAYIDLGDQIPEPKIKVTAESKTTESGVQHGQFHWEWELTGLSQAEMMNWVALKTLDHDGKWLLDEAKYKPYAQSVYATALEKVNADFKTNGDGGYFNYPVFVRYAARLYNGDYCMQSAPIMVDANEFATLLEFKFDYDVTYSGSGPYTVEFDIKRRQSPDTGHSYPQLVQPFVVKFEIDAASRTEMQGWSDIVTDIELFISTELNPIPTDVGPIDKSYTESSVAYPAVFHQKVMTNGELMEQMLSHSQFYLIKHMSVDEYVVQTEVISTEGMTDIYGDNLVVKSTLPDDDGTHEKLLPASIETFNQRLVLSGARCQYMDGYYSLPSSVSSTIGFQAAKIKYYIKDENGITVKVLKDYTTYPGPWLFYPDRRCYKADVFIKRSGDWYKTSISMKEDDYLNGAYCYGSMTNSVWWRGTVDSNPDFTTQPYSERSNVLYQSEVANPFVFPNEKQFTGQLLGVGYVTKALSTGQFGYADLYAFTTDGILTLAATTDGTIGESRMLSQDVAIEGTVCPIDQAIVFTTKKGVMLLSGSEIRCLSENMNGKHYTLESDAKELLNGSLWATLASMMTDTDSFMQFAGAAKAVYDYTGKRIVLLRSDKQYAYVYMLLTDTWHKQEIPSGYSFSRVLNSYPDSYVSAKLSHNYYSLLDLSTALDAATSEDEWYGIVATRPFSLDADDVRKTIRDIRVRGAFDKGDVQYILLGSMDGISFGVLPSLRGGSYKWFRLVLACKMKAAERLSWVDVDYEVRWTNRLR